MRLKRMLAALLAALLLMTSLPASLAEDVAPEAALEDAAPAPEIPPEDAAPQTALEPEEDWDADETITFAQDAGDTGLVIELEDAPTDDDPVEDEPQELAWDDGEVPLDEVTVPSDDDDEEPEDEAVEASDMEQADGGAPAGEASVGLGVAARTQEEIQAFVNAHPAYRNQINLFGIAPIDAPYAPGRLSPVNQQSALNMVNQIRFIAGLGSDVGFYPEQEDAMAATALVIRLYSEQYKAQNGKDILSHYPGRAAAIADAAYDALFSAGYVGAGKANIAMGYTVTGSLLAYMSDSDANNVKTVGHRRWILNPALGRTIFGANGRFSAMYAHDLSAAGGETKVAWPAQEMPLQYFNAGDPWSLSFGKALTADGISVSLMRARDGRTWNFSTAAADGDFAVENSAYGQRGCVIFRPNDLDGIAEGDVFDVSVTDGAAGEVTRYTVRFFMLNLDACAALPLVENVTAIKTAVGNELSWSAADGAQSYYVCRRESTAGYYQIVADLAATSFLDADVSQDAVYYYQVYARDAVRTSRSAVSVEATPIAPEAIALSASGTVNVFRNTTLQLAVGYAPANALAKLTWKTSKAKIATVDENGLVTPVRRGSAIISVTTDNGLQASVKVKVVNPPKAARVNLNVSGTVVLNVGDTLQLSGSVEPIEADQSLRWSSSRRKVAVVSDTGLITALKAGTATIKAKSASGKKARLKVKVVDPYAPDSVVLNYTGIVTLKVGEVLQLGAAVLPETAQTTLRWSTSRKRVAAVSAEGLVTALRRGSATITVRTANGKKAKLKIRVVR